MDSRRCILKLEALAKPPSVSSLYRYVAWLSTLLPNITAGIGCPWSDLDLSWALPVLLPCRRWISTHAVVARLPMLLPCRRWISTHVVAARLPVLLPVAGGSLPMPLLLVCPCFSPASPPPLVDLYPCRCCSPACARASAGAPLPCSLCCR